MNLKSTNNHRMIVILFRYTLMAEIFNYFYLLTKYANHTDQHLQDLNYLTAYFFFLDCLDNSIEVPVVLFLLVGQ